MNLNFNSAQSTPATLPALIPMPPAVPDFGTCEDEPIRVPGSIQQHGFLLLVNEVTGNVLAASENVERFLGFPLKLILGAHVDELLEREVLSSVHALTLSGETQPGLVTYLGAFPLRGDLYTVAAHHVGTQLVLEFERDDRLTSPELMNAVITNFVAKLSKLQTELELCRAITRQVRDLTQFDRVLLYSFDEAGHGTVLAEENNGTLPVYLGLHFPASDIPRQARELYVLNTVRIIPSATYTPSPLRGLPGMPVEALDLSLSVLRSVSPIHLEYMRNMGTQASMSVSIVCEGKLWGLISCHHAQSRSVTYLVRSACDLLTKLVGTQLVGLRTTAMLASKLQFHEVQRSILTRMVAEKDYISALTTQLDSVGRIAGAEGTAIVLDDYCELSGATPAREDVLRLVDWLKTRPDLEFFQSASLQSEVPWAAGLAEAVSGMVAVRISAHRQSYLLWFRPEVVRTVNWAGKPSSLFDKTPTLNPRVSFESWKELLRGHSEPWSEASIESAQEFRAALIAINLKRAEEEIELGEARFQELTHTLPNLVWTATDGGEVTYVNRRWRDHGLKAHGRWFEQERLSPQEQLRCAVLWASAVAEGASFDMELRLQASSENSERWYLVRATPYIVAGGFRAGWVGTFTDLTDRRDHERALQMNEKLALTGRMTSVIAHEINNPLEAITNLLYLMLGEVPEGSTAKSYIKLAESELQRISGITKQTLRWSRESGSKAGSGTVADLFTDVQQLFDGNLRNREVRVEVLEGAAIPIFGTISQLQQVLANLVSNAIAAVPVGGCIQLSAAIEGNDVVISVADNGPGMSPETQAQIFEPFYSTKGDLGNGLGLYISREIMEKHNGRISVDSAVGAGTRMYIHLPVA